MYEIYRADGQDYHVYPSGKEKFLTDFPDAQLISTVGEEQEETKKMEPAAEEAALAVGQNVMDLQREGGFLESLEETLPSRIAKEQQEADKKYIFRAEKGTIPGDLDFEGEYIVSKKELFDNKSLNINSEEDLQKYLQYQFKKGKFVNEYAEDPFLTATGQEAKAQVLKKEEEEAARQEFKSYYENPKTTTFGAMPDEETGKFLPSQLLEADAYKRSFLNKAEKDLKANKAVDAIISDDEVYNLAEDYYIEDKRNKKFNLNIENIAEKSKNRVKLLKEEGKIAKGLSDVGNLDSRNTLIKNKIIQEEAQKIKDYVGKLNNVVLRNEKELDEYKAIQENVTRKASYINKEFQNTDKELAKAIEKLDKADEINDIIRKDYGTVSNIVGRTIASTYELAGGLLNIPAYVFSAIEGGIDAITEENVNLGNFEESGLMLGKLLSGMGQEIRGGLARDKSIEELKGLGDLATWFGNLVGNQLPIIGTLAATGGTAGLWAMGATTAGSKYAEMMGEMDKNPLISYSRGQLFAAPAIVGTAEALSERVTFNQLNVLKSAFKKSPSFKEAVTSYVKGITAKGVAGGIVQEGGSEVIAQASENLVDAFMLDKDISLDRGLIDAFASGAVMSAGIFKAPLIFKQVFNPFRSRDTELEIARGNQIIESLNQEMSKLNQGNPADKKQLEYLANAVNEIKAKQVKYLAKDLSNIDNLTTSQKEELIKLNSEIGKIRLDAAEVSNNSKTKNAYNLAIQPLKEKYDSLTQRKETILQSANENNYDPASLERSILGSYQTKGLTRDFYLNKRVELLNEEIKNLEEIKKGVKDPERIAMLDLKIKNRQAQLAYSVPSAMGIAGTDFSTAKGIKKASLDFVNGSRELLELLNTKDPNLRITQEEYNARYAKLRQSFERAKSRLASKPKEFTKLQAIYDKYNVKKGETMPDKAALEFQNAMGGIVESIAKRLYDPVPENLRGDYTRSKFIGDTKRNMVMLIQTEFDPQKQGLDAFLSNRGNLRAMRFNNEMFDQVFTDNIDDAVSAIDSQMQSEMAVEEAQEKIDSAKALGIELDTATVEKELLKNYDVDSKSFKRNIKSGFINEFRDKIDAFMGKNTKTKQDFDNNLAKNAEAIYDTLTVEGMRMARMEGGLNPFEEAGMLVFKNGQLEKVAFKNINKDEFVKYFSDPSLKKQARSNRQKSLKEAMTVSVAAAHAIKILNTNKILQDKIIDLNQLKQEIGKNLNKNYDLSQAIEIAQIRDINSLQKLIGIEGDIVINDSNRLSIQQEVQKLAESGDIAPWMIDRAANFAFHGRAKDLTTGKRIEKPARFSLYYGKSDPAFLQAVNAAKENWKGKNFSIKRVGIPKAKLSKEWKNKNKAQEKENMDALVYFSEHLNSLVQANKMPVNMAAMFIYNSYATTTGLIKVAAPFKYASKVFEYGKSMKQAIGKKFREEHNPPSSVVGASIIWGIKNNQLGAVLESVKENYYQTQLSKKADEQLDNAKLDATLPEGKSIFDNPAARFAAAGIDLNTIENIETGQTLAEEQKVVSESTPDAVKIANEVVIEDKVEFIIDRAIARLTELTGTKGLAIDPFLLLAAKDVSLNVLVGGLRAVKLAYKGGKGLAKAIDAGYQSVKKYMSEAEWLEFARIATSEIADVQSPGKVRLSIFNETGVAKAQEQVRKQSEKLLKDLGIETIGLSTEEINDKLNTLRKARLVAVDKKAPKKKARVFDFDDTLAQSKSNVLYTLPDGTTGKLNATEFAAQSEQLMEAGAEFDFSEFSKVIDGSKGPLAVLAKKLTEAKGDRDIFVLTARPANSAEAIQSFLRSALGISIPLENITGLGDGAPGAKAFWMAEKVAEGYNDLFFADDAPKNVAAVNKILTDLGVKKKVQVAKEAEAPSLEDNMDNILRSKKPTKGSFFRKFNIYVPPGADDFAGLLYTFLGSGKVGEAQMKFFQDNLMKPFAAGIAAYEAAKVSLASDYKGLKKRYKNKKVLKEKILDGLYTKEQAVRAYLYERAGYDLGMNKADAAGLIAIVESDASLKSFAQELALITKIPEGYPEITEDWLGGNIQTDLANVSNKAQRKMFLAEFIQNKNEIFSDINMKLIKQMHGNDFTDALKNVLERMETGVNRKKGKDKEFNLAMDWINQSVANVMAINIRSAVLQQLSIVNFMNWSFNNPLMVGKAMANVPQFAADFIELWNSSFLTERRGGLKIEINTADLANSEPGNWFLKTHKKLLELGFKPTQWGDSFAISFGGASWFRNRTNQLIKQGVSEAEAKEQAMLEFQEIAETTQQSSRPDKISRQQASEIGRFILAFANTPLQYARETKKATLDLVNRRGDWKTNASKIVYYGVAQNVIFSALQSALFSLLLSDDEDDEKAEKQLGYFANGIFDGFLRGMGYSGAIIAALKNLGMEYYDQRKKREAGERVYDPALGLIQAGLTISPPLSKKIGDIVEAQKFENWRQYKDVPFYQGFAVANYVSALTNIPLDRAFKKVENLAHIGQAGNAAWQDILLALGWSPYQLDVEPIISKGKKKSKIKDVVKKSTPLKKESLPEGVLGKAHKDGTIQVAPGLSPAKKKEVIAHEKKHIADMKSGKLGYDTSNVYWDGNKYPRTSDKKIIYDGVAYDEGHKHLPWEKSANNIKV